MKNNNKIKTWAIILVMFAIFSMVVGFILDSMVGLSAKVNNYQEKVQNYQSALTIISTRLTEIEVNMDWIMKFVLPPDLYYELKNSKE